MNDSVKSDLILSELKDMRSDMQTMKSDMQTVKSDMLSMKSDIQNINHRLTGLELHIENSTDKNIQLMAENFIELSKKLNQAIPAANKNLAYEVKVNYLLEEFEKIKSSISHS